MAQLRRSACILYQSKEFVPIIHKVEKEIECGLIAVRQEKHILADLGEGFNYAYFLLMTVLIFFFSSVNIFYRSFDFRHQESNFKDVAFIQLSLVTHWFRGL